MAYQQTQWIPRTTLGKQVVEGKITSIREVFENNIPIKEPEIVDALLPDIKHEVLDVNIVQKQTDAGEITKFKIGVVVGNNDGMIGIGIGKSKQMRFAIDKAVAAAKLNLT
ncbi:MAG: 30S ribosomal protein S5, partial [Candidatus Methanomethylicia archaeon]|nr:30S ribosomal protein S5 [Candidatus Methanomethylicia archaeon]